VREADLGEFDEDRFEDRGFEFFAASAGCRARGHDHLLKIPCVSYLVALR